MRIGLKSGKVFECNDESYTESNTFTGELIHIFVSLENRKKYTVKDEDIEFFESDLTQEDMTELGTYDGCEEEEDCIDTSFG